MKFKDILSKINEKNEEGKPETTKKFASETPGQEEAAPKKEGVKFDTDIQYDGAKVAADLDPVAGEKTSTKKTLDMIKKGASESANKKNTTYEGYIPEKLTLDDPVGTWIKDFQKSDAPQFAGKSSEDRKKMALAAYYSKQKKEETISEDQASDWKQIQSMDKGSVLDGKEGSRKKLAYLNAVLTFNRKYGKDTLKVKKEIESLNRSRLAEEDGGVPKATGGLKDACWKGYTAVGMKMKNGKKVPNCVPVEEEFEIDEMKSVKDIQAAAEKRKMKEEVELEEAAGQHKVSVTVSEPNHSMVTKRKEQIAKRVIVNAEDKEQAVAKAKEYYKKKGYKVHDAEYHSAQPKSTMKNEEVEQISESEEKSISRLKQLVRFGLMDKGQLPVLTRAMKSLEKGQVTNPSERGVLFELLNELIGLVTGDDAMFAKVRMNVQKEEFQLSESHFKVGDEVVCKASGMEGEIIKVDPEEEGKYYTVEREDGKIMKYAPEELELEDDDEEDDDEEDDEKEMKEGFVVKYHDKSGAHKNTSRVFSDRIKAAAHAAKGNSVDRVGGKYTVHKIDDEGRDVKEELKGNQHKLDKHKNGKLDSDDFKKLRKETTEEQTAVAPAPGDKWKTHAVMVNTRGKPQRVVIDRKNMKNYPSSDGWKEVSPGQKG